MSANASDLVCKRAQKGAKERFRVNFFAGCFFRRAGGAFPIWDTFGPILRHFQDDWEVVVSL